MWRHIVHHLALSILSPEVAVSPLPDRSHFWYPTDRSNSYKTVSNSVDDLIENQNELVRIIPAVVVSGSSVLRRVRSKREKIRFFWRKRTVVSLSVHKVSTTRRWRNPAAYNNTLRITISIWEIPECETCCWLRLKSSPEVKFLSRLLLIFWGLLYMCSAIHSSVCIKTRPE